MTFDPATAERVAQGMEKSQGYYLAAIIALGLTAIAAAVVALFWLLKASLDARTEDWKKRASDLEETLKNERTARELQHDRMLITSERMTEIARVLELRLPKPKPAKEVANG